jgi:hypothetical protein
VRGRFRVTKNCKLSPVCLTSVCQQTILPVTAVKATEPAPKQPKRPPREVALAARYKPGGKACGGRPAKAARGKRGRAAGAVPEEEQYHDALDDAERGAGGGRDAWQDAEEGAHLAAVPPGRAAELWGRARDAMRDGRLRRLLYSEQYSVVSAVFSRLFPDDFDRVGGWGEGRCGEGGRERGWLARAASTLNPITSPTLEPYFNPPARPPTRVHQVVPVFNFRETDILMRQW